MLVVAYYNCAGSGVCKGIGKVTALMNYGDNRFTFSLCGYFAVTVYRGNRCIGAGPGGRYISIRIFIKVAAALISRALAVIKAIVMAVKFFAALLFADFFCIAYTHFIGFIGKGKVGDGISMNSCPNLGSAYFCDGGICLIGGIKMTVSRREIAAQSTVCIAKNKGHCLGGVFFYKHSVCIKHFAREGCKSNIAYCCGIKIGGIFLTLVGNSFKNSISMIRTLDNNAAAVF